MVTKASVNQNAENVRRRADTLISNRMLNISEE